MEQYQYELYLNEHQINCEVTLPTAVEEHPAYLQPIIDEVTKKMIETAGIDKGQVPCVTECGRNATTIIHRPTLFNKATPPLYADLCQPVCGSAQCSTLAHAQFQEDMKTATGGNSVPELSHCHNCEKTESMVGKQLLRCSRCKVANYCDAACQKAHWKKHKAVCIAAV